MARTYSVEYNMGGAPIELRYTTKERDELEDRFNCGLLELLQDKVLPTKDGKYTGGGVWRAQVALVFLGLRHAGPKMKEPAIEAWMSGLAKKQGGECFGVILTAANACLASGALGFVPPETEDEEGKAGDVPEAQ